VTVKFVTRKDIKEVPEDLT